MNIEATIIVMVYKNLDQVRQTLDSIKKQTYSNYEVIVSDDGSPNYTQEDFDKITEQYKNEFTYFKLINNGINRGTVKHFNSLIKQAKGTIICPLSSGDQFYNENSLQEIMNAFDQEDKLIYTSKRMIKKENNIEYSIHGVGGCTCCGLEVRQEGKSYPTDKILEVINGYLKNHWIYVQENKYQDSLRYDSLDILG